MSLALKIVIFGHNVTKTMRFVGDMSIQEVLKEIQEKTTTGGADHGLFEPPVQNLQGEIVQTGRWLKESKSLAFYNIQSGVRLFYKRFYKY